MIEEPCQGERQPSLVFFRGKLMIFQKFSLLLVTRLDRIIGLYQ